MRKKNTYKKPTAFQLKPVCAALLIAFGSPQAISNPMGGVVVNGQANMATVGNTLTVTNTPGTIINWQGFSIGANEVTRFIQQSASSAVLNRVIGNNHSNILGTLQSNGRVFLINPNGIVFGAGSVVDVAGLVASTLNMSNADFLAGRYNFTKVPGAQNISNAGNLNAQQGGQIFLIAPNVDNSGVINAPGGEILLAAGNSVELVNSLDPNLRVNITSPAGNVTNLGQLVADAGNLGLFGAVVKNSGSVSADSATMQGGKIVFRSSQHTEVSGTVSAKGVGGGEIKVLSDMQSGTVQVSGTLDASAPNSGKGGFIETSAAHVQIADSARVSTLAAKGKAGMWLIDPTDFYISATDPANGSSWMSNATLSTNLGAGNVLIQTLATGAGNGDIFVNGAINKTGTGATTLTLQAINNININAGIASTGGALDVVLNADSDSSGVGAINLGTTTISLNGGTMSALTAAGSSGVVNLSTGTATINSAANFSTLNFSGGTLAGTGNTTVANAMTWTGGTLTGHLITQGTTTIPSGNITLGANALWDNTGTVTITSGGWGYIGTNAILNNSGTFDIGGNFATNFNGTGGAQFNNLLGGTVTLSGIYSAPITGNGGTFNNSGTLNKTSATTQSINNLSNSGTLNVNAGTLNLLGTWSNMAGATPGTINVGNGTVLNLGGSFNLAGLGNYTRSGGTVNITGTLDLQNSATPFDLSGTGQLGTGGLGTLSGTLLNGTITGASLTSSSGTLDNISIGSSMTESGTLYINNNLLLGDGVNFDVGASQVRFNSAASTIGLVAGATTGILSHTSILYANQSSNAGVVTIANGVTVRGSGSLSQIYGSGGWINNGVIENNTAGTLNINPTTFTNNGIVRASAGITTISPTNLILGVGNTLDVAGGTLNIQPTNAWSNAAGNTSISAGTLNLGGSFNLAGLGNYTRSGGTVNITGTLDLQNSATPFDLSGTGQLGTGGLGTLSGTLLNGTITGASLTSSSGTLDNISIGSSMTESGTLYINNNLLLGDGVNFDVGASQVRFNSAASTIGLVAGATTGILSHTSILYANQSSNAGVVTIANGVTVRGSGSLSQIYGSGGWINNGVIENNTAGTLNINPTNFTNNGVMSVTAGTMTISPTNFTNTATGTITSSGASTLNITPTNLSNAGSITLGGTAATIGAGTNTWTNTGSIALNAGALNLAGSFSAAQLAPINYTRLVGTTLNLTGSYDNTGSTLDIGNAGIFGAGGLNLLTGTIKNGTLVSNDGTVLNASQAGGGVRILDGVAIGSNLTVNGELDFQHGLLLVDGITVNKGSGNWYFDGQYASQAANTVHHLGMVGGTGTATVNSTGGIIQIYAANGQTLQIDNGITLQGYGTLNQYWGANSIINEGAIIGNTAGQTFTINPTTFTNNGVMSVTAGTMTISPTNFTNTATGTITSSGASTLNITPTNLSNAGSITLGGTAATLGSSTNAWTNTGSIALNAGGLSLAGTFGAAQLAPANYTRAAGTTVNLAGIYDNTGNTLDIGSAGMFGTGGLTTINGVTGGGTIKGGTLISGDGTALTLAGGWTALDGVTLGDATHQTFTTAGNLSFFNGLTLADGMTVNKGNGNWYFNGQDDPKVAGTVHHLATLGTSTVNSTGGNIYIWASNGQTLQIDSGVTLQGYGYLTQYWGGNSIINEGTIIGNTAGQTLYINPTTFTNNGVMSVTAGTMTISPTNFTNTATGSITSSGASTLNITPTSLSNAGSITLGGTAATIGSGTNTWTNTGSIALNTGALNLAGGFSATQLAPANYSRAAGTTVNLAGIYDNTSSTLDIGSAGIFGTGGLNNLSGTIKNGTLVSNDGTVLKTSGDRILDGVTIGSNLTLNGELNIYHNLTLADGVTVNKGASNWYFNGYDTGTGTAGAAATAGTVHHLATLGSSTVNSTGGYIYIWASNGQTLQIDSGVTVQGYGYLAQYWSGNSIINNGSIFANTAGQTFTANPDNFTNNGLISIAAGATFARTTGFTNTGTIAGHGTLNLGTSTLINSGIIAPGDAAGDNTGALFIQGNLQMGVGGQLNMDVNSALSGDYDTLRVSGTANLSSGTLNISGTGTTDDIMLLTTGAGLGGTAFLSINGGGVLASPQYLTKSLMFSNTDLTGMIVWDGGAGTSNWADVANWSNALLPTATSNLYIGANAGSVTISSGAQAANRLISNSTIVLSGGSLTLDGDSSLTGLIISNGTLAGAGALSISNGLTWNSGTINRTGVTTIAGSSSANSGTLYGALTNLGTLDIVGTGFFQIGATGVLTNASGGQINHTKTGGDWRFVNGGVLTNQLGGTVDLQSNISLWSNGVGANAINNYGTFTKTTGTVVGVDGNIAFNSFDGSTFHNAAGTRVDLYGGSFSGVSTGTGDGLNIAGGNWTGTGTIAGNWRWTAGSLNGNLTNAGNLSIWGASGFAEIGGTGVLTNASGGQINYTKTGGDWRFVNGAVLNNQLGGTVDLQSNISLWSNGVGANAINNYGTFTKTTGTVVGVDGYIAFNSYGGSTFHNAAGTRVDLYGGSFSGAGVSTGTGEGPNIAGGNWTGSGTIAGNWRWSGGSLNGNLTNTGNLSIWGTSGFAEIGGTGVLTNASGGQINYTKTGGDWRFVNGGVLTNQLGGTVDLQSNISLWSNGVGANAINNYGAFTKTTGTVVGVDGNIAFNSYDGSTFHNAAGTRVDLYGGSFSGVSTGTGDGLNIAGGNWTGTGTIAGNWRWTAGSLNGNLTNAGNLSIWGASGFAEIGGTGVLTNASGGQINYTKTGGDWRFVNGAVLNNQLGGTVDLQSNISLWSNGIGANAINNAGMFTKTAGVSTSVNGAINFTNTGDVRVRSGTLAIPTFAVNDGNIEVDAGTTFSKAGAFTNNGTLSGAGTISVGAGNTLTNNGIIAPGSVSGDTTGALSITGNLVMGTGGQLDVQMDSLVTGYFDQLNVSGTANLAGGVLNLSGFGGAGSYAVINATGGLGGSQFSSIAASSFSLNPTYGASTLTLGVISNNLAAVFWDGGAGTSDWADVLNWSTDLLPTLTDNVLIGASYGNVYINSGAQYGFRLTCDTGLVIAGGSLSLAADSSIVTLALNGGQLNSSGILDVGAFTNAAGSTLSLSGTLNVAQSMTNLGTIAINNPGTSVINVAGDFTNAASITAVATSGLTLRANDNIVFATGSTFTAASGGANLMLNSDYDGVSGGAILLDTGSSIVSNGGNIVLGGGVAGDGSGNAIGSTLYGDGITLSGTTVDAGGGSVTLRGTGLAGTTLANGIYLTGSSVLRTSGAGNIGLFGTGGAGVSDNSGIRIGTNSSVQVVNGGITLSGTGGASTGSFNMGVYVHNGAAITATGSGFISITGKGGSVGTLGGSNRGVRVDTAAVLSTNTGGMSIYGTGGYDGDGFHLLGGASLQSVSGSILVDGSSGVGNGADYGVWMSGAGTQIASGGNITVNGTSLALLGTGNTGLSIDAAAVIAGSGTSNINLYGSTSSSGDGFQLLGGAQVLAGTGTITLTGNSSNGDGSDYGVWIDGAGTLISGSGTISVTGNSGAMSGTSNRGLDIGASAGISALGNAAINLIAVGGQDGDGMVIQSGATIRSVNGAISLTGTSGNGPGSDRGINLKGASTLVSSTSGNINISGSSIATAGSGNHGVMMSTGAGVTTGGNLTLVGATSTAGSLGISIAGKPALSDTLSANVLTLITSNGASIAADSTVSSSTLNTGASSVIINGALTTSHISMGGGSLALNGSMGALSTLTMNGGTLSSVSSLVADSVNLSNTVSITSPLTVSTALNLSNVSASINSLTNNGALSGSGTLTLAGGLLNNGSINPGGASATGTLTINGDVQLSATSSLNIDIGGTGVGQFDLLNVNGNITLAGALNVNKLASYTPVNVDAISFLTASGTATGTFTGSSLPSGFSTGYNLAAGEAARLIYAGGPNTFTFTNAAGGLDWSQAGNWSGGLLPGVLDTALISAGYAVTHSVGNDTIAGLTINLDNSLNVSGGSLTISGLTTLDGALTVSGTGSAILGGMLSGATSGQLNVAGGSLSLGVASSVTTLSMSGGVLDGAGDLTVTTNFDWLSGTMQGMGNTIVGAGVTAGNIVTNLNGYSSPVLTRTLINEGTISQHHNGIAGSLTIDAGGVLDNRGTYMFSTDSADINGTGGQIINSGTFGKSGGTSVNNISAAFTNSASGTVSVTSGTLLQSGAFTQAGTLNVTSGAAFSLTSGFINTGTITGSGSIVVGTGAAALINNGTITLGTAGTLGTLSISGDLVMGAGSEVNIDLGGTGAGQYDVLHVTGNVTNAGTLNTSLVNGYVPVNADAISFLTKGGTASGTFTTVNLPAGFSTGYNLAAGEAARLIYASGPSTFTFTNAAGGLDWSQAGNWSSGILPGVLDNALISAGYAVTHSVGNDTIAGLTINLGNSLDVSGGSLTVTGLTDVAGVLAVSGGTLTLDGLANVNVLSLSNGTLNGAGALNISGGLNMAGGTLSKSGVSTLLAGSSSTWTNGNLAGTVTLDTSATLNLNANNYYTAVLNGTLNNNGTVNIAPNSFLNIDGGTLNNAGVLNLNNDNTINISGIYLHAGGALNNQAAGTINVSGNYVSFIDTVSYGGAVTNSGTVNVNSGSLNYYSNGQTHSGAFNTAAGADLNLSGTGTYSGAFSSQGVTNFNGINTLGVTATGNGNFNLSGGTLTGAINGMGANLNITGGTLLNALLGSGYTINLNGGTLQDSTAQAGSVVNWTNGSLAGTITLDTSATLNLNANNYYTAVLNGTLNNNGTVNIAPNSFLNIDGGTL
ncbi:MAG: filamentous hemagglutinin N-terminal domain-containing protein, partial [Gallionella sp.]|nr:filamentous hemagglutinin N-terminal domain-containing protein [Gallionella sp.]